MASNSTNETDTDKLPSIINLNVGGTIITTRLSTLSMGPSNMLSTMFSGKHHIDTDSEGRYFIDRDGTYFSHILNYIRNPSEFIIPLDIIPVVLAEARYYQINSLEKLLSGHPSLLANRVVTGYRTSLGVRYEKLKKDVISKLSEKLRPSNTFLPVSTFDVCSSTAGNLVSPNPHSSDSEDTEHTPSYFPQAQPFQGTLQTEVRIATPQVAFEPVDTSSVPQTNSQSVLRRNHQIPYSTCLDGHDFVDIDITSTYWEKSDVWNLLLQDLRHDLNTSVELKREQNTIYCRRCQYKNPYLISILSVSWLKNIPAMCSFQDNNYIITSQSQESDAT